MILIILTSFISLLVTINSGRGQWQLDMVNDTSIIQNIKGYFSSLNILGLFSKFFQKKDISRIRFYNKRLFRSLRARYGEK